MAAKEQKTQSELEKIIMSRCSDEGMQLTSVTVTPETATGWAASFRAAPHLELQYRPGFDMIVQKARDTFDLRM
jgi:hypothetical protein